MNRREILFRGKTLYGHWVYGSLIIDAFGNHQIVTYKLGPKGKSQITDHYEVDPSTIGQYTGLTDKNGVNIWEGDIFLDRNGKNYEVFWHDQSFCFSCETKPDPYSYHLWQFKPENIEVIGTIHDTHLTQQS